MCLLVDSWTFFFLCSCIACRMSCLCFGSPIRSGALPNRPAWLFISSMAASSRLFAAWSVLHRSRFLSQSRTWTFTPVDTVDFLPSMRTMARTVVVRPVVLFRFRRIVTGGRYGGRRRFTFAPAWLHSSTDRMEVSGTSDSGSIPLGATDSVCKSLKTTRLSTFFLVWWLF